MAGENSSRGSRAADSLKRGAEVTANSIHQVTNFVAKNDDRVADGAKVVTHLVGQGLDKARRGIPATVRESSRAFTLAAGHT